MIIKVGRTPHGVRELKPVGGIGKVVRLCRTPHGVRELKPEMRLAERLQSRRTPHGVRELKHFDLVLVCKKSAVAPHTGCVN